MATKTNDGNNSGSNIETATQLLLDREERRQKKSKKRAERKLREQLQADRESVQRMHRSIEVIKWCIVGICAVWVVSFIISIVVLVKVNNRVAEIDGKVRRIQHVIENPFASAGARYGAEIDQKLKQYLRLPEPEAESE